MHRTQPDSQQDVFVWTSRLPGSGTDCHSPSAALSLSSQQNLYCKSLLSYVSLKFKWPL